MGVSYWDAQITPAAIIAQDLEYIDLEEKVKNRKRAEE